ncbi:MAG: ATP-grasp domain-containing protein [Deltaproteobacteria bacterium]|nr:ATP-grasp domain-containing protein [Deltaproteobacteria bacterium]
MPAAATSRRSGYEDDQLPVVVSAPKAVQREWRFVVGDGAVVAGCEYQESREGVGTDVPDGARALAMRVAEADWQAAALYVVDVGDVDGDYRVMELNPLSGADLYHCDPAAVVEAASRIAQRLFEDAAGGS